MHHLQQYLELIRIEVSILVVLLASMSKGNSDQKNEITPVRS